MDGPNATRLGDFLHFAYLVTLNIQPFSQGRNFLGKLPLGVLIILENQAVQKLIKETFGLIKNILDLLIGLGTSGKKKEELG